MKTIVISIVTAILFPFVLTAQLPIGFIAKYQLDNSAIDISGNNYNGSLTSTANSTDRFGAGNSATGFTAGSSVGSLPGSLVTALQADFTIGFWFNTTMIASGSSQWYGGNAILDAEMCGGASDWGVALIDGGAVCMGIGNPDITIKSPASTYNDGNWHFVTVTRSMASGTIVLYMEGSQVALSTGTTTALLTAPTYIGLARNPCAPSGVYTGGIDDIIVYDRVLNNTEVTTLYNEMLAYTLPLNWLSFTGEYSKGSVNLKWEVEKQVNTDYFAIEHSSNGTHFSIKGSRTKTDGVETGAGRISFSFSDGSPIKGTQFYRIRQTDTDGKYSYSKVIKVTVGAGASIVSIKGNPVVNELVLTNQNSIRIQRLQITDLSGRTVSNQFLNSTDAVIKINVEKLLPGYYLLKINSGAENLSLTFIKH